MIEEASKRGHLFAIVINSQNEVHQSLTLNILHGTPQGMTKYTKYNVVDIYLQYVIKEYLHV